MARPPIKNWWFTFYSIVIQIYVVMSQMFKLCSDCFFVKLFRNMWSIIANLNSTIQVTVILSYLSLDIWLYIIQNRRINRFLSVQFTCIFFVFRRFLYGVQMHKISQLFRLHKRYNLSFSHKCIDVETRGTFLLAA